MASAASASATSSAAASGARVVPTVVISVPHSCQTLTGADLQRCDTNADVLAKQLGSEIRGARVVYALADEPRTKCDLNRVQCRNEPFRQRLRAFVNNPASGTCLVLDVHTFGDTPDDLPLAQRSPVQRRIGTWHHPNMCIMVVCLNPVSPSDPASALPCFCYRLAQRLADFVNYTSRGQLYVHVEHEEPVIDIFQEMTRDCGTPCMLFEFNMHNGGDTNQQLTQLIAAWVSAEIIS